MDAKRLGPGDASPDVRRELLDQPAPKFTQHEARRYQKYDLCHIACVVHNDSLVTPSTRRKPDPGASRSSAVLVGFIRFKTRRLLPPFPTQPFGGAPRGTDLEC